MATRIDPAQQERLHRIMNLQTTKSDEAETTHISSGNMAAKKSSISPLLIIVGMVIFVAVYTVFWMYYFKML